MADRKKILDYLGKNVKDYAVGVDLIAEFCSPTVAASYRNASPRFMMPQVLALLRRLANAPASSHSVKVAKSEVVAASAPSKTTNTKPQVVKEAKAMLHQLYLSMVDFHNRLVAMGDGNSESECSARVTLMRERQPVVELFVEVDDLVRDYFATDEVPARLVELVRKQSSSPQDTASPSEIEKIRNFSDLDLAKEYKRTKSNINRRHNKLRFQSTVSQQELNPMPEGPLRKQVESEIAQLKTYIKAIMDEQRKRGLIK